MSLQPTRLYVVPEQTARITKAVFPKGTLCLQLYDHLGTIFEDQDFADLFPRRGQPAVAPFRLALVTVLQFVEGLSDRAAADAVRGRAWIGNIYCVWSWTTRGLIIRCCANFASGCRRAELSAGCLTNSWRHCGSTSW